MRLIVDIYQGWQGIEFKPIGIAEVFEVEGDGWPKRRQKPLIKLGIEGGEREALDQVRLWVEAGKPLMQGLPADEQAAGAATGAALRDAPPSV